MKTDGGGCGREGEGGKIVDKGGCGVGGGGERRDETG